MSSVVCVCALVLIFAVCQATHVIKGLYCKDPDTGLLYAVNSTWPSQTFCGNYTCKLRKKNTTETQYLPVQKINITDLIAKQENHDDMAISPSENSISVTSKIDSEKHPIFYKDFAKPKDKEILFDAKGSKDSDRYLTESEIKVITDMLHSVKKSDLEAIVDIYNLAQDIYKEIDTVSTKSLVQETIETDKLEKLKAQKLEERDSNNKQYWYDPLQFRNKHIDMSHEGTNVISTKKSTTEANPTFFKGVLTDKDFGKLPYYYPISNFQRLSSYMHPKSNSVNLEDAPKENKPCDKQSNYYNYMAIPWYGNPTKKSETQAIVQPSTLLPYPFSYIYRYNVSGYPSNYYPSSSYYSAYYPWTHAGYSKQRSYPQSYYGQYVSAYPSYTYKQAIENKESLESNERNNLLDDLVKKPAEKKKLPDWQTEPLSEKVLEEVRAFVTDKPKPLKSISLKKNIKLEKVGKVIKLDELTREKRDTVNDMMALNDDKTDEEELEAYIEKTTCEDTTEVGYFSYGNMTQPYPGCCPKKIDSIHTTRSTTRKEVINTNK